MPFQTMLEFKVLQMVRRIARAGRHVMPLQDLMQHDPVEKAAEPQPEKQPRRNAGLSGE
jgi:hypothetical protein